MPSGQETEWAYSTPQTHTGAEIVVVVTVVNVCSMLTDFQNSFTDTADNLQQNDH